jgi:hypothetical protein
MSIVVSKLHPRRGEEMYRDKKECGAMAKNGDHNADGKIYRTSDGDARHVTGARPPTVH